MCLLGSCWLATAAVTLVGSTQVVRPLPRHAPRRLHSFEKELEASIVGGIDRPGSSAVEGDAAAHSARSLVDDALWQRKRGSAVGGDAADDGGAPGAAHLLIDRDDDEHLSLGFIEIFDAANFEWHWFVRIRLSGASRALRIEEETVVLLALVGDALPALLAAVDDDCSPGVGA